MRNGFLFIALAAGFLLAPAAGAGAAELGYWRVQATASIQYDWTITTKQSCESNGSGRLSATIVGARSKRFKMGYFARGGFKHWAIYPGQVKPTGGKVTLTDSTTQNPPEDEFDVCTPASKRNCVTRPISRRSTFVDVSGKNARRNVGARFSVNGLLAAMESLSPGCERAGFSDWSRFLGSPAGDDYGATVVKMPSASRIGRRAFTVTSTERFSGRSGITSARTLRRVTLRFTPA
jgi:hypothetical protein